MKTSCYTLFILLIANTLVAQKSFSYGPSVGYFYTSIGDSDYYIVQPENFGAVTFGVSGRVSFEKWNFRSDVLYKSFDVMANDDAQINSVQRQTRETSLIQSAVFIYAGGEYHFSSNGTRPFIGAGLDFGILLNYEYAVDVCVTTSSGSKSSNSRVDDSNEGGEYGVYVSGGLVIQDHINFELRYHAGSRNRSDFSIPVKRATVLATYFF